MKLKKHEIANVFYVVLTIILFILIVAEIMKATRRNDWYVCRHDRLCEKTLYNKNDCSCYQRFVENGE